jgi:hypothetical protein
MFSIRQVAAISMLLLFCGSLPSNAADFTAIDETRVAVVVVPTGWESAVETWREYRRSQGYSIEIIPVESTAEKTQAAIRAKVQAVGRPNVFVLLAADAMPINQIHALEAGEPYVPTFYRPSEAIVRFGGEPEIATDYPYGDLDGDGMCECAVGRIPANSASQLEQILKRSIEYEQYSICGNWQYEMNLVAGVGGFSMLADMAINGFAKSVLMESLPKEFQLSVAQASPHSPYFPPANRFRNAVIDQLNRNSLLWVYMGHGGIQELDQIQFDDKLYPILSGNDVTALKSSRSKSLAFLLACYSGAFDAPMPCLSEMMLKSDQGPVAVVGATRVSMPYGMGMIGKEMLREAFVNHTSTIGEVLRNAKQTSMLVDTSSSDEESGSLDALMSSMAQALSPIDHSLTKELEEHRWLMNLLGDPTLVFPSSQKLEFECTQDMSAKAIRLKGRADIAGELVVEIRYDRGQIPAYARKLMAAENQTRKDKRDVSEQDAMQRYLAVNDTVLVQTNKAIGKGDFNAELKLPEDCSGDYLVRCTVCNRKQSAVGVSSILIRR